MDGKKLKLLFIFFCVLISLALCACTKQEIKFYRESKVQSLLAPVQNQNSKSELTHSSGVYIYKTNSEQNETNEKNVNFGPGDLKFDLPLKFK